ncbi:MAG TPA: murein biosynthesis integral membrane protein MurJ [Opitutaceae bacterium]|nr:murein biosynthesis integral membrane protein MurJ [Opitutaceae bacterium]
MSKKLKNIGVVSVLTVVSRFLGVWRDALGVGIFGASGLYSAFLAAWTMPNLFRRLLAEGSLTAAFIPTLQEEMHERGREGAHRLLSQVTSWLLLVSGVLVGIGVLLCRNARLLAGHPDRWYQAADLAALLFPYLIFIALAAACNATLNVYERFTEPTLSPIFLNVIMIASYAGVWWHLAKNPWAEIHWLVGGVLLGGFVQFATSAGVLVHAGWRPRLDLSVSPRIVEIGRLMLPGLFGTAIYQVNVTVSRLLAFSINGAAVTQLFNANRLMEFPIGVFAIAVSTVVYPLIARHAVEGNRAAMAEDYRKGLRLILIINVPAAVGLALLGHPIVDFLYRHGRFGADDAAFMARLLSFFVVGLPFFSVVSLTVRAFYAVKDTRTPVRVATVDFFVNLGLSVGLMHLLRADWHRATEGLVVASTSAIIVQTLLLQRALVRRLPAMTFAPLWPSVAKVALATALMGAAVRAGWIGLGHAPLSPRARDVGAIFGLIPLGIALYGGALWLLRIEGQEDLAVLLRRFRRGGRARARAASGAD